MKNYNKAIKIQKAMEKIIAVRKKEQQVREMRKWQKDEGSLHM